MPITINPYIKSEIPNNSKFILVGEKITNKHTPESNIFISIPRMKKPVVVFIFNIAAVIGRFVRTYIRTRFVCLLAIAYVVGR